MHNCIYAFMYNCTVMLYFTFSSQLQKQLYNDQCSSSYTTYYCNNDYNSLKLELAKYYKDSEMTAYISERSKKSYFFNPFEFLLLSEIKAVILESLQYFANSSFSSRRGRIIIIKFVQCFVISFESKPSLQVPQESWRIGEDDFRRLLLHF